MRRALAALAAPAAIPFVLLVGCSDAGDGGEQATPARTPVVVVASEYTFTPPADLLVAAGDTVTLHLENHGTLADELEVLGPTGEAIGAVPPTAPGNGGAVTVAFDEAGTYRLVCGIVGHAEAGMVLDLVVT